MLAAIARLFLLRPLFTTSVDDGAYRDRRRYLSAEHRSPFCSLRDELIYCEQHEIHPRMDDHWTIAAERRAERRTSAAELGNRSVDDALLAELAVEVGHRVSHVPRTPEPLSYREYRRMVLQQILEAVADRRAVTCCDGCLFQIFFAIEPL